MASHGPKFPFPGLSHHPAPRPAPPAHGCGRKDDDDPCERRLKKHHHKKHHHC